MNEYLQHPLDSIYPNNSLLLLEAMIPYVDSSLKLPLALLIKMQEIRILIQVFHNPSHMEMCGLNRSGGNTEEMLSALCQAMGVDIMGQMKQMQQMMNVMNSMQAMNDTTTSGVPDIHEFMNAMHSAASTPSAETEATEENSTLSATGDELIDAIRTILSEQEGESHEPESIT